MVLAMAWNAPGGVEMLPDLIATILLGGMMLIPLVNVITGVVIGSALAGPTGAFGGLCFAFLVMAAERWLIALWSRTPSPVAPRAPVAPARTEPTPVLDLSHWVEPLDRAA